MQQLLNTTQPVVLIEPRKAIVDSLQSKLPAGVKLVVRVLDDNIKETILYTTESQHYALSQSHSFSHRQIVYSTTIKDIIDELGIQHIDNLFLNLNIDNIPQIIQSTLPYNHIISSISLHKDVHTSPTHPVLESYFTVQEEEDPDGYHSYVHKNINMQQPHMCLALLDKVPNHLIDKFNTTSSQLNITSVVLSTKQKLLHDNITHALDNIFANNEADSAELILLLNPKYLNNHDYIHVLYPVEDNVIYIDKTTDTFYASKACFRMLHQIIRSKYYTSYFNDKPKILPFLARKYFYEYFSTVFVFKNYA